MPKVKSQSEPESYCFQANIHETTQRVKIISDPRQVELGLNGHLEHEGKRILVVKGHDTMAVAFQIYNLLSSEPDDGGNPFRLSRKRRGLVHTDIVWNSPAKVTGADMERYVSRYFLPCQLVESAANGRALILMDKIPMLFIGTIMQPRFIAPVAELFEAID